MLTVHALSFDRIVSCAADIYAADRDELRAAGVEDATMMLLEAVPECLWAQEARWNGAPIAIFGVRPLPPGEVGIPWMLTTVHMQDAERAAVARAAVRAVRRMRADFPSLMNMVHAHNERALRFVEWLGFHVEHELTGPGYQFRRFSWRRACATP
jgi:RimJ/RimL family protein N-acetyltransferase